MRLFDTLDFLADGALYFPEQAASCLEVLRFALSDYPSDQAGVRLKDLACRDLLSGPDGAIGSVAADLLGESSRPVRAILFDKTPAMNWALGWHQDRTICVTRPADVAGFGPWTVKAGMHHVAPPFSLLESMVTLRIHLDDVSIDNAPLRVALGSHRLGRIPTMKIADAVALSTEIQCTAHAGDIWAYSTPILHASDAAIIASRRRVLQIDYTAAELPEGLSWLGI